MGKRNELNLVDCFIGFDDRGNNTLIDQDLIVQDIKKEVKEIFKKYHVKHSFPEFGGKGGGFEDIYELLRTAWEHREYIKLLVQILVLSLSIPKQLSSIVKRKLSQSEPVVFIGLSIRGEVKYQDDQLGLQIGKLLINLKSINDEICVTLSNKYPFFHFDQHIDAFLSAFHFSVSFNIPYDKNTAINQFRMRRLLKNIVVIEHRHIFYKFIKLNFVQRTDWYMESLGFGYASASSSPKNYYMLLSTKILSDYMYSFNKSIKPLSEYIFK